MQITLAARRKTTLIRDRIVKRAIQRIRAKRGPMTPPFVLEYRHVFVLPTSFGWSFGLLLVLMTLGGLNFNNNMTLILAFLLATIAQITTMIAYRNLAGLSVDSILAEPVFCGDNGRFRVYISHQGDHHRYAVQCGFQEAQDCVDFGIGSSVSMQLSHPTVARGWLDMPSFKLETRFPLGMFKAWSWVFPQTRCLVYPRPAKKAPPLPRTGHGHAGKAVKGEGEQIYGLRKYQPGDSFNRVAWRSSARHDELYSLEMEAPREEACELDWDLLQGLDTEKRLSILTAWIIAAEHKQLVYSLRLPGEHVPPGIGGEQRARCLELLALFDG